MHSRIFIALGSNLGDREQNLAAARIEIERDIGQLVAQSSIYETVPVDLTGQPLFLNQTIEITSLLSPLDVLERCLRIEEGLGRVRDLPKGPRVIDLDLLFYGNKLIHASGGVDLDVPHLRATSRRFVLEPLAEIAPEFIDPISGRSIASLLKELPLKPGVARWRPQLSSARTTRDELT